MHRSVVELLAELVSVPSPNPMGMPNPGEEYGEGRLTAKLESLFDRWEIPHWRQSVHPGRENIVAQLEGAGRAAGIVVLLEAHQDTVPAEGMTIPPWKPTLEGGRIYGRGACDVKGGMAAMLAALARLARERRRDAPTVLLACSVNEEYGCSGAEALARAMVGGAEAVLPSPPQAAIIAEPTQLRTVVAHKGVVRWVLETRGRAAHSATPDAGESAIYRMAPVIEALRRYHQEVLPAMGHHRLCGGATLSVGTIRGGISVNTIPDRCAIEVDRRLMPSESPEDARRHLTAYLEERLEPGSFEIAPPYLQVPPLADSENGPLAERLGRSIEAVTGEEQRVGVPYATDAPFFAQAGIPTVVFGPGSIEQAHTKDEWISIAQLEAAAEILYQFLVGFAD